jgi:hemophore-related protein
MIDVTKYFGRTAVVVACTAVSIATAGPALADDNPPAPLPPNCTAADLADVLTDVTAATAVYLRQHPDVNDFLTNVQSPDKDQMRQQIDAFFDAHPWVRADWQAIRKPSDDFRARCGNVETP